MKFKSNGVEYMSTQDVAARLGVTDTTIRSLIRRGVLPDVPKQRVGAKAQRGFTEDWVQAAEAILEERASR